MSRVFIPDQEYKDRLAKAAELAGRMNLDALIVNGNEADYGNIRYLSGFWPLFERCGVVVTPEGKSAILVGPESRYFAADMGKIDKVFVMMEYRESADPEVPELAMDSFGDVFKWLGVKVEAPRIGIAAWLDTNLVMYDGVRQAFPKAEIVRADEIMKKLRSVKSSNEIDCIREATRISSAALDKVMNAIKPGMTELQLVGVAQQSIYSDGAEYEGLPIFIVSNHKTKQAVSRASHHAFAKGDFVQIGVSAKVDGYSPTLGYPVSLGSLDSSRRELVNFGLEMHNWTVEHLKPGVSAAKIASDFFDTYKQRGFEKNFLYGPCHGTGLVEVEAPWMETTSDYELKEGMCFEVDTFALAEEYGLRFEKPVAITRDGCEAMGTIVDAFREIDV